MISWVMLNTVSLIKKKLLLTKSFNSSVNQHEKPIYLLYFSCIDCFGIIYTNDFCIFFIICEKNVSFFSIQVLKQTPCLRCKELY